MIELISCLICYSPKEKFKKIKRDSKQDKNILRLHLTYMDIVLRPRLMS